MRIAGRNGRALVAAVVVALVVGGTAYATEQINGSAIKPNSIPLGKLTKAARAQLAQPGPQGPRGSEGPRGAEGIQGPRGETGPAGPTEHSYGVAALFVDGERQEPLWSPTIPPDGVNAALASATSIVYCDVAEAPCDLDVRAVVRSDVAGFSGVGGMQLIVTNAGNGALVAIGETPGNPLFAEHGVLPIDTVPLKSNEPTTLAPALLPVTWTFGSDELAAGTFLVQEDAEFFANR